MQSTSYIPGRWAGNPEANISCFKPISNSTSLGTQSTPCQRGKRNAVESSEADPFNTVVSTSPTKRIPRTVPKSSLHRTCRLHVGTGCSKSWVAAGCINTRKAEQLQTALHPHAMSYTRDCKKLLSHATTGREQQPGRLAIDD